MINPRNPTHLARLNGAIKWSDQQLDHLRKRRTTIIRQQVGSHWGVKGAPQDVALGMLRQAKQTYGRQLAARNPRVLITTIYPQMKNLSAQFQRVVNRLLREMQFQETLSQIVDDALEAIGIVKIGIERGGNADITGWLHDPNLPFIDRVSLDDYTCDMSVTDKHKCRFESDKYWVPMSDLKSFPHFRSVGRVTPQKHDGYGEFGGEKAITIGTDLADAEADVEDMVQIRDVYLRPEKAVISMPVGQPELLIGEMDWDGPEAGPYGTLGYGRVSDNLMPFSPLELIFDLHMLANAVFGKLSKQARGQKKFGVGPRGDNELNEAMKDVKDGQFIGVPLAGLQHVREMSLGGIDGGNAAFVIEVLRRLDMLGGNISLLGGLAAQSPTATQDQMLNQNAGAMLAELMDYTVAFTKDVIERLGWYWWHHPTMRVDEQMTIAGTDLAVPVHLGPRERMEGDFAQHNFAIEPYSMRHLTPQQHLRNMVEFFTGIMIPALPDLQQQGVTLNWQKFVELYSDYSQSPQIRELLSFGAPLPVPPGPVGPPPARAAHTMHESVRVNKPGHTQSGQETALIQAFQGKPPQEAEVAGLFR